MTPFPSGGIYVIQGEISALMASMKKVHWSARSYLEEENNPLLKNLNELKVILNQISDLKEIELNTFLGPFLEIIHSSETTVQVTALALSSINKFITYGLIGGVTDIELLPIVESIAETVSHANFITTDYPSDAVILMKIVEVLRTLVMSPLGILLTNDSICEIMLSCFRICFEVRLSELLRQNAEHCLRDIVRMLFQRLPLFTQSSLTEGTNYKKMRIRSKIVGSNQKKKKKRVNADENLQTTVVENENTVQTESVAFSEKLENEERNSSDTGFKNESEETNATVVDTDDQCKNLEPDHVHDIQDSGDVSDKVQSEIKEMEENSEKNKNAIENVTTSPIELNSQLFTFQQINQESDNYQFSNHSQANEPHNSVCVQELLRFLSLICNPHDKQNTDVMIHVSLSLLVISLEVGSNSICKHPALLNIIKDTLCRNLLFLLQTEKLQIFTMNLHVSFLIFESMRSYLKFQLEYYLSRLSDIIILDTSKIPYEKKEIALESLVQLWKIPGLVTELFLNYDCDLYCPNLYEEITKLLSKNVYPVAGIYNTHLLSLDALLTVVESIEKHCHSRISNEKTNDQGFQNETIYPNIHPTSDITQAEASKNQQDGVFVNIPTHEQLMAIKRKKKLIATGTEHFNANPKKGILFLQEQGLLSTPLEPSEVATFLKENPHLNKKMIGEFISHRNNTHVLESFVKSFDFTDMRIDEALRVYLETFRLPGESPLISLIMQQFADHWHKCNNEPFAKSDAAFVLAYAVIMLNVDQHNQIVRRQNTPMTIDDFKKNLKGVDSGKDFDQDLLEEIYQAIKNEEIVMPAEHTGLLKENYLWKVLLRRGASKDGRYVLAQDGLYDHELFSICWGPSVTALGYVFDKAVDSSIYYKSIQGFRKCATISAHYGMSNEFDYLTLSLCKFTTLLSPFDNPDSFVVSFGMNSKARLAARTVFSLVHRYGDILREGWKPIFDCIFQLFRCKLLPKILIEAEDFLELSGKVSIVRDDPSSQKNTESGILSSLYSYITLATDVSNQRFTTDEEQECTEIANTCIVDCHLENLILESKFLRLESLHELLKVLIRACYNTENQILVRNKQEEDKAIFFLELLLKVVIQNRDRVNTLWPIVCDHMNLLLLTAANSQQNFLVERCIIGFLRLSIRLMRKEEISSSVLQSLNILMLIKWSILSPTCRQIAYGLHELIKTGAANIHTSSDWNVIFTILEVVGAGAPVCKFQPTAPGENPASDDNTEGAAEDSGLGGDKICLSGSDSSLNRALSSPMGSSFNLESKNLDLGLAYTSEDLMAHDPFALVKCCESLAFLVRDVAHITPFNFEYCVRCIRTFVEATFYSGDKRSGRKKSNVKVRPNRKSITKKTKSSNMTNYGNPYDADESDPDEYPDSYYQVPLQLLDLMHTLHTRTAQIYRWWAEEISETDISGLWPRGWCPLLRGISRLCCDPRKQVRMNAITYLQRALLVHDLQTLTADEWSSCFSNVLFPLMDKLLDEPLNEKDPIAMEETRMRAATLLSKVFLHHLAPLQTLSSFTLLWLRILDVMDNYMNIDKHGDLLNEAIQESVKNMILVMESANLFIDDNTKKCGQPFWEATWQRVDQFLPNLKGELYRHHSPINEFNDQQTMALISSSISSMECNRTDETEIPKKEDDLLIENSSIDLTKHSIPIFPHMGQLISTPIGRVINDDNDELTLSNPSNENSSQIRSDNADSVVKEDREIEKIECDILNESKIEFNNGIQKLLPSNTELSSLTTSSDFLATLPSIKPHASSEFVTPLRSEYYPADVSASFPVYSGFGELNNDHNNCKKDNCSQFFYQNLSEYPPVIFTPKDASHKPTVDTSDEARTTSAINSSNDVIDEAPATSSVNSSNGKFVEEP